MLQVYSLTSLSRGFLLAFLVLTSGAFVGVCLQACNGGRDLSWRLTFVRAGPSCYVTIVKQIVLLFQPHDAKAYAITYTICFVMPCLNTYGIMYVDDANVQLGSCCCFLNWTAGIVSIL